MRLRQRHVCQVLGFSSTRLHTLRREGKLPESGKDADGFYWTDHALARYINQGQDKNEDYATEALQRLTLVLAEPDQHRRPGRPVTTEAQ